MNKTLKKFLKYVIALILTMSICYLGYFCCEQFITTEKREITWKLLLYFFGFYFIVIKPVCDHWGGLICKILDLDLNDEN